MPAPHWLSLFGQAHSPLFGSLVGQVGTPAAPDGNTVVLDFRRAFSWAGVRLPLTERIRPAIPETMGAEKLVPRFGFVSLV